jgi:hypothetical protein
VRLSGDSSIPVSLVAGSDPLIRDGAGVSEQVGIQRLVQSGIPDVCEVVTQLFAADGAKHCGRVGDATGGGQQEIALGQGFL